MPIAADEAADFDPEAVPTVGRLLTELGSKPAGQPTQKVRRHRADPRHPPHRYSHAMSSTISGYAAR